MLKYRINYRFFYRINMTGLNENLISITKANQNFSEVARKCKELGRVYILKNNKIAFSLECIDNVQSEDFEITDEEMFQVASKRILKKYHKAFEELAKWLSLITTKFFYFIRNDIWRTTKRSFGAQNFYCSSLSRIMVNGPSFMSSTFISAPNLPRFTFKPS